VTSLQMYLWIVVVRSKDGGDMKINGHQPVWLIA